MKKYDYILQKLKGGLSENDRKKIDNFFNTLDSRIDLPIVRKTELINHFYEAFEYYFDNNYSIDKIIKLIDPKYLGDFYLNNERQYLSLDNAAIIYPLGMRYGQMPLFRLSVNLKSEVVPSILQLALDFTIKRFPSFSAVIKTGIFWHYLETTNYIPEIELENDVPCKPISIILRSTKSFRVLYYKKRISIEFFHVITDGSGGMVFLKTLLGEYFRLLNKKIEYSHDVLDINEKVDPKELVNEFNNCKADDDFNTFLDKNSLQLDGKLTKVTINRITHFELSSNQVLAKAHEHNVSVTAYILGILFIACKKNISKKKGLINIQVPVNMRKFYSSKTLRNFSMYFSASRNIEDIDDFDELVKDIHKQIQEKGSEAIMSQMVATTGKLIELVNYVPVILKAPIIQIVYGYLGNSIIANTLSNLGKISLPEQMDKLVDSFDFILTPYKPNRVSCTLLSYKDKMRLTISKSTKANTYELDIYNFLIEQGLKVNVEGSEDYES